MVSTGSVCAAGRSCCTAHRWRSPDTLSWTPVTISRVRVAGALGVSAPPGATAAVLIGGWLTPGYDPFARTISRLAAPGVPAAFAVELAIAGVGVALIALAIGLGPGSRAGRALLLLAGAGLMVAAAIRLDPASASATAGHRVATTAAMLALAGAPFAFASYGRISFAFGAAEVGMLLLGLALLPTTFAAWGAWERCFLALPMAWMFVLSARLLRASRTDPMFSSTPENSNWPSNVSTDETMKVVAASHSSSGP